MINAAIGLRILECVCWAVGLIVAEPGYPVAPAHSPTKDALERATALGASSVGQGA